MTRAKDDGERLEAIGIHVVSDDDGPGGARIRAECIRIARRLFHSQRKVIGLLPASDDIGVSSVAVQLGLALAEVSGATVAFVDANVRWPAISELAGGVEPDAGSGFATRWLRGSLALLTPPRAGDAGAGVPHLARVLREGSELFAQVLVDLTGFKRLGEHLAAIEMVDAVAVIARAAHTTERTLLRLAHELPPAKNLGVLLLGA
jgi:hypothetical protein